MDGIVESIGAAVVENPFAKDSSRQFRQVMLSMSGDQQQTPIGLRVSVQFTVCLRTERSRQADGRAQPTSRRLVATDDVGRLAVPATGSFQ
jgi:hypothetical protein